MTMKQRQKIFANAELRAAKIEDDSNEMVVEGYALKFEKETQLYSWLKESIARGALDDADMSDVVLDLNHDMNTVVSRIGSEQFPLEITVDEIGLFIRATIADTNLGKDLYKQIKSGLVRQMSFMADVEEVESTHVESDDSYVDVIKRIKRLYDVAAVTFPAYDDTNIEARALEMRKNERTNMDEAKTVEEVVEEVVEVEVEVEVEEVAEVDAADETEVVTEERSTSIVAQVTPKAVEKRAKSSKTSKENVYSTVAYRNAWAQSVKDGDSSFVKRFLSTTGIAPNNGAVLIPTVLADMIETGLRYGGTLAALANVKSIKGLYEVPIQISGDPAGVHVEGQPALPEENIVLGSVKLEPRFLKKWIRATDEIEALAIDDYASWLMEELSDAILMLADERIITGADAQGKGILGIVPNTSSYLVSNLPVVDLKFNTGYSAIGRLDRGMAQGAVAIMNMLTYFDTVMGLTDSTGQPIARTFMDSNDKPVYLYAGMRVVFSDALAAYSPTLADDTPFMVVGNMAGYTLNLPNGMNVEIVRDAVSQAELDIIKYVAKLFAAGNVTKKGSFVVLKKASA